MALSKKKSSARKTNDEVRSPRGERASVPRLGVNIDHIATLRQLRGTPYPSITDAGRICEEAGAEQITVHLREDRRHIQPEDVLALRKMLKIPLNLEMAVTPAMVKFALKVKPEWVCLVPEKRNEVTTEGGLDLKKRKPLLVKSIKTLQKAGIRVSLFVEPSLGAMKRSAELGADAIELHTGRYCIAAQAAQASEGSKRTAWLKKEKAELARIREAGILAYELGLHVHAGHGFDYENVRPVCELIGPDRKPLIEEYNIGHAIVCRAAMVGLQRSVREMVSAIAAP